MFGACCSMGFIDTLSFAILALMKWVHMQLPFLNYGWIIIILVLLVRLILHPVTKSSTGFYDEDAKTWTAGRGDTQKIRRQQAGNEPPDDGAISKNRARRRCLGCLPMLLQMPIWIALYSAIYAGIELRGAKFLPFWITDLCGSDAIFSFTPVTIPLIGRYRILQSAAYPSGGRDVSSSRSLRLPAPSRRERTDAAAAKNDVDYDADNDAAVLV